MADSNNAREQRQPLKNKLGIASGVLRYFTPVQTIRAAAAAGWDMVGIFVDPSTWTDGYTEEVLAALRSTNLEVIDVENIRLFPGPLIPDAIKVLDVGIALGAPNVLVISEDPDIKGSAKKMRQLCQYLESKGSGMRVNIEFGYFNSGCHTIDQANAILDIVDHPLAAILIDVLHVFRSGHSPEAVAAIPRDRISYSQICDGWKQGPDVNDKAAILEEALKDRPLIGKGDLNVTGVIKALPEGCPLSDETRYRPLEKQYPDAEERSKVILKTLQAYLAATY